MSLDVRTDHDPDPNIFYKPDLDPTKNPKPDPDLTKRTRIRIRKPDCKGTLLVGNIGEKKGIVKKQ